MKAIHIFLTILAISNFNLIAQHYIGQNELNWLKESKKSYDNVVGEKSTNFEVYLEGASKSNGYLSDVMVGFDKLKYQRGEIVTLTFKRSGSNSRVENERIAILGTTNVSANGFEIEKGQHYSIFYLKTNEVKKVFIQLRNKNQLLDRITMGIGRMGIASEGRGYIISYPPVANENENKKDTSSVKPEWRYFEPNNHHDFFLKSNNSNASRQLTNISGIMQFENPLDNDNLAPVNHWTLTVYEADDPGDLNTPNDEFNTSYEINSTGNGGYSIDLDISMDYYLLELALVRLDQEHDHMVYRMENI